MIAGCGFAWMAWKTAWERKNEGYPDPGPPVPRHRADFGLQFGEQHVAFPISREYYRILDRAWGFRNPHPRDYGYTVRL